MTTITKKVLRGNDIALPKSGQEKSCLAEFDLWQCHLTKAFGLPSSIASAYSSIIDMGANPYGK